MYINRVCSDKLSGSDLNDKCTKRNCKIKGCSSLLISTVKTVNQCVKNKSFS